MKLLDVVWDVGLVRSVQLPLSACWLLKLCHGTPGLLSSITSFSALF